MPHFQPVMVEEPSVADTIDILKGIKGYYETFHGLKIPDLTVERAVILSERYITDRFLPDKAIDLLDEAAAYLALRSPEIKRAELASKTLSAIRKDREAAEAEEATTDEALNAKYQKIAELRAREYAAEAEFKEASATRDRIALTTEELAEVIEVCAALISAGVS